MSSKKSRIKVYPKNSFDRFGDDLCQLILTYLSLEDKLAFECVSNQWKELIYKSSDQLVIDEELVKNWTKTNIMNKKYREFWPFLARLLRRVRYIQSISIDVDLKTRDQLSEQLIKYCHHLNAIETDDYTLTQFLGQEFFQTYGQTLKSFRIDGKDFEGHQYLQYCPKLAEIDVKSLSLLFNPNNKLMVKKLKKCCFKYRDEDSIQFKSLVEMNRKSLKSITLNIHKECREKSLNSMRKQLTNLKNLNDLTLSFPKKVSIDWLRTMIADIAHNCCQLKRFCLAAKCVQISDKLKILESIDSHLNRVKRLNLNLFDFSSNEAFEPNVVINVQSLKSFKELTHLGLDLGNYAINDHFFTNIEEYLPKLQSIRISFANITELAINSLSNLKCIQNIEIAVFDKTEIRRRSIKRISTNCLKIRKIDIKNC